MSVVWRRLFIFFVSLMPFCWILYRGFTDQLGADPQKTLMVFMGTWTFYFLLITLSVTPIKQFLKQSWVMVHRRMLGLFTLFYAVLHVVSYYVFILDSDLSHFGEELVKRPYILVTIPAVILLLAQGVTSTQGMMRKLGKHWLTLHKGIYLVAFLGFIHVLWQVRSSYADAVLFGLLTAALLGMRVVIFLRRQRRRA